MSGHIPLLRVDKSSCASENRGILEFIPQGRLKIIRNKSPGYSQSSGMYFAQILTVMLLVRIGCVLTQDELLYQGVGDPAPHVDESTGEDQAWSAIARRIVEVGEGARDQIASDA